VRSDGNEDAPSDTVNRNLKPVLCELSLSSVDIVPQNEQYSLPLCLLLGDRIERNSFVAAKITLEILYSPVKSSYLPLQSSRTISLNSFLSQHERHAHYKNMFGYILSWAIHP
jgi:hypothetical protein